MNEYFSAGMARDRVERYVADAAASRRAKEARRARRSRRTTLRTAA